MGLAGGWKEVRSVAGAPNKALSGAPSPRDDPGPAPLSRGVPRPSLGGGRSSTPRGRTPGSGLLPPPPESGLFWGLEGRARGPPRRRDGQLLLLLNRTPPPELKDRGRRVDFMLLFSLRKWGDSGTHWSHSSASSPGGAGLPSGRKWRPTSPRFLLPRDGPRLRRQREGTLANSCSSYIFHYTIR